jgi:PKD repeat protein
LTSIVVILIALTILGVGDAPPILPSSFYGTVMVNGAYISDGTIISAWIDGNKYAEVGTSNFEGKTVYTIKILADNSDTVEKDGGEEGDTVVFKIGSEIADQTGSWHSGTNVEVNLTVSTTPPAPTANFSGSPLSGDAPLMVDFVDSSSGSISSWSWDFGDSGSSSAQNPSHEYTTSGTYTVALTVTGPGGSDTETKVDYITVTEPIPTPTADFSGTPTSGDAPLTVDFTDLSSGSITSWSWSFGDGGSSTSASPSYEYTSPGTYTVALTVIGPGGSDTETKVDYITIYEEIIANFSAAPTSGASPMNVSFSDLSTGEVTSWSWTFGDGGSSSLPNPSHQYTSPGLYTITLTVAGPAGSDSETKIEYVEVAEPGSLVADFTGTPVLGVAPLTVSFTQLSSGDVISWLWTFGDGGSSTDPNPTYVYTSPDVFTVSLKVSNSEGFDIEQKLNYIAVSEISSESYIVYLPVIHQ